MPDMTILPLFFWVGLAALLGLVLGSFAGLVVYRLPRMIEGDEPLNLCFPASHCGLCKHPLLWWHNIPVLSYLLLRGRCDFCGGHIGRSHLLIELAFAALWAGCVARLGPGAQALVWGGFFSVLLVLAIIDAQTLLLPDVLTLPLCGAGLCLAALQLTGVNVFLALAAAVLGYGVLAAVAWVFERRCGVAAMGGGDPKLMAALGAWLGLQALLPILLMSSLLHIALALVLTGGRKRQEVPFGPGLALAAALYWIFQDQAWMQLLGGSFGTPWVL
jgi:leader peptidase (prepilin peptidase) / N-methyltransferase